MASLDNNDNNGYQEEDMRNMASVGSHDGHRSPTLMSTETVAGQSRQSRSSADRLRIPERNSMGQSPRAVRKRDIVLDSDRAAGRSRAVYVCHRVPFTHPEYSILFWYLLDLKITYSHRTIFDVVFLFFVN